MTFLENLYGEVQSGVLAGLAVSPAVAVVDKAVFSSASGRMTRQKSFKECGMLLLVNPMKFFKKTTFKMCFVVYASTFATANCSDRIARLNGYNPITTSFIATSFVNIYLNIWKDNYLTREFSVGKFRPLPRGSIICYAIRDIITVGGAFAMVDPVAAKLQNYVFFSWFAHLISQSFCPVASQLLNTPFFIYGMDLYNKPKAGLLERLNNVRKTYWKVYYWSRLARVGPAYSVGGLLNSFFRYCYTDPIPNVKEEQKKNDNI